MQPPHDRSSLDEIRAAIDQLDQQVIDLLAQRFAYVKAAASFK